MLLFASSCFASDLIALQNRVSLNTMLTTFPELREENIRLVPSVSSDLVVCEDPNDEESCSLRRGTYHSRTDTMFIQKDLNPFQLSYSLLHEFGHDVYRTKLEPWERKAWEKLFEEDPNYVSEYSKFSASENFAEWFSIYKYGQRGTGTYTGVEMVFDSAQADFMDKVYPKYRKPL